MSRPNLFPVEAPTGTGRCNFVFQGHDTDVISLLCISLSPCRAGRKPKTVFQDAKLAASSGLAIQLGGLRQASNPPERLKIRTSSKPLFRPCNVGSRVQTMQGALINEHHRRRRSHPPPRVANHEVRCWACTHHMCTIHPTGEVSPSTPLAPGLSQVLPGMPTTPPPPPHIMSLESSCALVECVL